MNKRFVLFLLAFAMCLFTSSVVGTSAPPLAMTLSTHVANEPAQVSVLLRVQPDARSRELTIEWWSEDGVGGSHSKRLDGDQEKLRHEYTIKRMEAGDYTVTARVGRNDGSQLKQISKVIVTGEGQRFGVSDLGWR